jgi:hypothetical protein
MPTGNEIISGDITLNDLVAMIVDVLNRQSTGVGEFPAVDSLNGVVSLPAIRGAGTTNEIVTVAMSLLKGTDGADGKTSQFSVGSVDKTPAGGNPTATLTPNGLDANDNPRFLLNITLPTGDNGAKPIFLTGAAGIEYKYEGEPDSAYRQLVTYDTLKLKFADLTSSQVEGMKLHFADLTEGDIAILQQPATDAATALGEYVVAKDEELSQLIEDTGTARDAANAAATNAGNAATTASNAADAASEATGEANAAAALANDKATTANNAAAAATTAAGSANTAATNANDAATAANSAADAASEAADDANTAASLANDKATAANNAAGAATTAAGSANTAATNANDAATAANSATDAANEAAGEATSAKDAAIAATSAAVELNANPPEIVDGEWWVYDFEQHEYVNTGLPARGPKGDTGDTGKPLIVLQNGNYGTWNPETEEYEDSGVEAAATVDIENQTVTFTEAEENTDIASGDAFPVLFGKIKKWLSSLGALAWKSSVDYETEVANKPSIPDEQIQSDWNQANGAQKDYIKNKPSFKTVFSQAITGSGNINPKLISDIQYNGTTGDITLKFSDGSNDKIINLPVDNFLSAASYDPETHILTQTMQNGEVIDVDLGDLIHEYEAAEDGGLEVINSNQFRIDDAVMSEIMKTPIQKETELDVADWTGNGDLWAYTVEDDDVTEGCLFEAWPSDRASKQVALNAEIDDNIIVDNGKFTITCVKKPHSDFSIVYTILT